MPRMARTLGFSRAGIHSSTGLQSNGIDAALGLEKHVAKEVGT